MTGLRVEGLSVRFGGNLAVDQLDLSGPVGQLTGLIGPNGAGKTTTFAAVSGLLRPTSGAISFLDHDITHASAPSRARLGLGRTFQRTQLCPTLSVVDNIALGFEARTAGSNPWRQLVSSRDERRRLREAVTNAIELCDLAALAGRPVAALSVGQRRLVELARAHAGNYRLLLLDEPSSGLDSDETTRFGSILRSLVEDGGLGILLVEHDMTLVMSVCDYLYTLDFGRLIFEGTPDETRSSPVVRAAYLGGEDGLEAIEAAHELAEVAI